MSNDSNRRIRGRRRSEADLLAESFAREHRIVPLRADGERVWFATERLPSPAIIRAVEYAVSLGAESPRACVFEVFDRALVGEAMRETYGHGCSGRGETALDAGSDGEATRLTSSPRAPDHYTVTFALVARVVALVRDAGAGASTFGYEGGLFTIRASMPAGNLPLTTPLPAAAGPLIIAVLKRVAHLDVSVTDRAQEGTFAVASAAEPHLTATVRVRMMPTPRGEECVLEVECT